MAKVKAETNLCRCCHEEGFFVNLGLPFKCSNNLEEHSLQDKSFCELIKFCFDIQITPVQENDVTYTICSMCIDSLLSAVQFKKQVISCEEKFKLMLSQKTMEKAGDEEIVSVKIEKMDEDDISESRKSPCITDDNNLFMYTNPSNNTGEKSTDETQESILFELLDTDNRGVNRRLRKRKPAPKKVPKPRIKNAKQNGKKTNEKDSRRNEQLPLEEKYTIEENGQKTYVCHCRKMFKYKRSFLEHFFCHVDNQKCPICRVDLKESPGRHLAEAHSLKQYFKNGYREFLPVEKCLCTQCDKEFPSGNFMVRHVNDVHKLHECSECSLQFNMYDLKVHKAKEHKIRGFSCGICNFTSINQTKLNIHQRKVHMKEKNVACDVCDMKFYDNGGLKKHFIVHAPERKFECAFCHKRYPRLSTCRMHEKIHKGEKNKVCQICGDKFVQKASLNYHMVKYHPDSVD